MSCPGPVGPFSASPPARSPSEQAARGPLGPMQGYMPVPSLMVPLSMKKAQGNSQSLQKYVRAQRK